VSKGEVGGSYDGVGQLDRGDQPYSWEQRKISKFIKLPTNKNIILI